MITSLVMCGVTAGFVIRTLEAGRKWNFREWCGFGLGTVNQIRVEGEWPVCLKLQEAEVAKRLRICFGNEELRVTFVE